MTQSITGRDGYIERQAFLYAIACIQALPEHKREWSNMSDMCTIVREIYPLDQIAFIAQDVEYHMGMAIDIWPDVNSEEANAYRAAFRAEIASYRRGAPVEAPAN